MTVNTDRPGTSDPSSPKSPKSQVFYAVVLHDFVAERADELDAKRGDPISVVAQSNREWFVAKPIGRLGRPGLIPVTFVEVRDPATNQAIQDIDSLMDRGDLPKVEDWKRAMLNYKQNSITLGVIEDSSSRGVSNSPFMSQQPLQPQPEPQKFTQNPYPVNQPQQNIQPPARDPTPDCLPDGLLLSADVVSFHYEMDEYWFRIDAIFQPYPQTGSSSLPSAKQLVLFRVYNDFYDFQVALLDTFPREAGRKPPHPRMLPYMPGPADHVDHEITATRRAELDDYLHKLCELNAAGAKYILEHRVVRTFLSLKPGDVENLVEPRVQEMQALLGYNFTGQDKSGDYIDPLADNDDDDGGVRDTLARLRISEEEELAKSDASDYEDEGYAPSPQRRAYERIHHPYNQQSDPRLPGHSTEPRRPSHTGESQHVTSLRQHALAHNRDRSRTSFNRTPSPFASNSRSNSPLPERSNQPLRNRFDEDRGSEYNHRLDDYPVTPSSVYSQPASLTGRSRSGSVAAAANLNTPPISAANSQTAFIKIKIFDRVADDLIAIRVHPRVSHAELMDKVQSRLGGEVVQLRYRDSMSNGFVDLHGDDSLRRWLAGTDKHVLYAD
jgi:bud emergence protein 1